MSKYCPEWIFSVFASQTSKEFLSSNNSIAGISRKYSKAISERYDEVKFEEIMDLAEKILQFLSDINAGEEAVNYINDYIHYRVNYESSGSERKLSGMFSSAFNAEKNKDYNSDKCFKIFIIASSLDIIGCDVILLFVLYFSNVDFLTKIATGLLLFIA